jgi:hypothetical protein
MRHLGKLAATGLAAGLLATACGSADVLQGLSPAQMVTLASSKVTGQSYRMAITGQVSIDASGVQGLPPDVINQMTTFLRNFSMNGKADVQSGQRLRMTMSMSIPTIGDKSVVAVLYDGHSYVSVNGGNDFADAGTFNLQGIAATPSDVKSLLAGATKVKDLGTTVHDGQRVEHLRATLGPSYLNDLLAKISGSGSGAAAVQQLRDFIKQVIQLNDGTLDVYVRTLDGRVEDVDSNVTMSLDMGKLISMLLNQYSGQIPSGSRVPQVSGLVVMKVTGSDRFSDYGAKITVTKPTVDPNAPGISNVFGTTGA